MKNVYSPLHAVLMATLLAAPREAITPFVSWLPEIAVCLQDS
jgi:hypothetical protein